MGENEWLNGYLEAILDVGTARSGNRGADEMVIRSEKKSLKNSSIRKKLDSDKFEDIWKQKQEKKIKSITPTKYFVEGVVNSFDEADLHRTWIKVRTYVDRSIMKFVDPCKNII